MKTKKPSAKSETPTPPTEAAAQSAAHAHDQAEPAAPSELDSAFPSFSEIATAPEDEAVLTPPRKTKQRQAFHWAWVPGIFLRPVKTIRAILEDEKPNWLLPMLLLSLMLIFNVVLSGPAQRNAIRSGLNMPPEFQYWSQEEQTNYMNAQASKSGATFIYAYPILGGVATWWVIWLLTASILHLMITLAGSRSPNVKAHNLVGWAMLPFALGLLVKGITVVASGRLLSPAPFASLLPAEATGIQLYARVVLGIVDAYWLWHAILLLLAAKPFSKLATGKALGAVLAVIVIMLLLQGLPGLLGGLLGSMSTGGTFF
jgi:hypothetical protein